MKQLRNTVKLPLLFTFLFAILASVVMYFHEMWRDEFQAWLVASSATNIPELISNMKYEGHPIGWFFILFLVSKITAMPAAIQIVHLLIAVFSVYLIFRFSPFSLAEKILLVCGYFFFYEYCIVSRNYAISIPLIIFICILLERNQMKGWLLGIPMIVLCQTNLYGGLIAGIISFYLLLKGYENRTNKKLLAQIAVAVLLCGAGLLLLYIQVKPASLMHYNDYYTWKGGLDSGRIIETGAEFFDVYFPIPSMEVKSSFGINMFADYPAFRFVIFLVVFGLIAWNLRKDRSLFLMYVCGTVGLLLVLYFNLHTSLRHEGFLYILFLITCWLARRTSGDAKAGTFLSGKKIFMTIIIVQCTSGIIAAGKDVLYPFSNIENAARYAVKQDYGNAPVGGMADYIVSPLSAYTHKPIYMPETRKEEMFIVWNDDRKEGDSALILLLKWTDTLLMKGESKARLVLGQALRNTDLTLITNGLLNDSTQITLVKRFDKPCIVGDELYYFYEVSRLETMPVSEGEK